MTSAILLVIALIGYIALYVQLGTIDELRETLAAKEIENATLQSQCEVLKGKLDAAENKLRPSVKAGEMPRKKPLVLRASGWANTRAALEERLEENPETERSKRVENYLGEGNA